MFDHLVGEEREWAYNSLDCSYTRIVGEAEADAIIKMGLQEVDKFQHRLFPAVLHAMLRGVRVDTKRKLEMSEFLAQEASKRERYLTKVLGHPINPRSPKQMQALFYQDFHLPPVWKRTPNGNVPTLDDGALEILQRKEPLIRPLVRAIQEYRTIGVLKSTFVDMELDVDGRMRCSYNICGTETYRFSSSENAFGSGGNLQNIPLKKGEDDENPSDLDLPDIRTLYIPDEGQTWFDLDLSKADLRTVVWESDCKEMKAMLAEGRDPYIETAREFYHDPTITKTTSDGRVHKKYDEFKKFSHGTHFLGTPQGLAQRIGLTVQEATKTQAWYFAKYPAIKRWQDRFISEIKRTHQVRNKFGYMRHYFGRIDDSTFREAIAWIPQSTTGCVINRIWVALFEEKSNVEVLMQVHDSINGQVPTEDLAAGLERIKRAGQVVIPYDDPLIIPVGIKTSSKSWGDCS